MAEGLYGCIAGQAEPEQPKGETPTPEQEEAATAFGTPVILDAGPGTGKTKTLVRRIVHLVREQDVDPQKILVLTFSNEAAVELQERIQTSLGNELAPRFARVNVPWLRCNPAKYFGTPCWVGCRFFDSR